MEFKPGSKLYFYEIERKAGETIAYVNFLGAPFVPSIARMPEVMEKVIDILGENPNISRVVLVQQRNYSYGGEQVMMLQEIAQLYEYLTKQENILHGSKLAFCEKCLGRRYSEMAKFLVLLKRDPIGAYNFVKRLGRSEPSIDDRCKDCNVAYRRLIEKITSLLEATKLIRRAVKFMDKYSGREVYEKIFRPDVLPNFVFTRLTALLPDEAEIIDQYEIGKGKDKSSVTILRRRGETRYFYHLLPPEYTLREEQQELVNLARNVLSEHRPKAEEFTDPERIRNIFFNIARDLLQELAEQKKIKLSYEELIKLSRILVRHTIGFGLLEILLQDEKLQDIVLNAPIALNPVYVRHEKYDECVTNIWPSQEDAEGWAAKLRMLSGRPLDEANPVLDTELLLEGVRARIAAIQQPLSPSGLAYAIRRHRDKPWTLPLFIKNKMLDSFTAGLLSFLIDGSRTLLVAGTRSAGKTSLLGSLMLEIMPKYRIIVVEDTLELPVTSLRKLGYDILRMKVRSALLSESTEIGADEGIRTSLRLGDSCLIVGEVRSTEARALYEAMRVGALANVVAGTIHGASPYGVFDRVVNDLGVPATSFKATDIIVVANPVKSPDGLHSYRRVVQVAEVRKHWTQDPLEENGFIDLLRYNVEKDRLEPTAELINGESEVIKAVAANVRGWAGNWDAVYDNIMLRAKVKQELVNTASKLNKPELLEADFVVKANNIFHEISDKVREEIGVPESKRVFPLWKDWLKSEVERI